MYRGLDINLNGFEGTIFVLILCFLFGILTAATTKDDNRGSLMVKLQSLPSLLLFLYIFKRKVTLWAVVMQICTYIALLIAVIAYKVIEIEPRRADEILKLIIGAYFGVCILMMLLDTFLYDLRKKY